MLFCPGQSPLSLALPRILAPHSFLLSAAAQAGLSGACALHVPTLAPLIPGHVPSVAVIPSCINRDRRFLIVDARRVAGAGHMHLWLQETSIVLNPVLALSLLRRSYPDLGSIGALYLDAVPLHGYTELTARVAVLPDNVDFTCLPTPLLNGRAFRTRRGFMQLDLRYHGSHRRRRATTSTTTGMLSLESGSTTTTTVMQSLATASGSVHPAAVRSTRGKQIRFLLACPDLHTEAVTLHGESTVVDVLAQLCMQLRAVRRLPPGLTFRTLDRVFSDADHGFSVFMIVEGQGCPEIAWIDAYTTGVGPFALALPFTLTPDSLHATLGADVCGLAVSVNGAPWHRNWRPLESGDVVMIRHRQSALFSLPLAFLEQRVEDITCLLIPRRGPGRAIVVHHDGLDEDVPPLYGSAPSNPDSILAHWRDVQLSWHVLRCDEGSYARCVLVASDIPPFPVSIGTRFSPEPAHVNMWYRTFLQRRFGPRHWHDAGLAYGDLTVLFDSDLHFFAHRAWLLVHDDVVDVIIADKDGISLACWPAPEGWVVRPIFTLGPLGQAALMPVCEEAPAVTHQTLPAASRTAEEEAPDARLSDDEGVAFT